jgi:hypothetical protein
MNQTLAVKYSSYPTITYDLLCPMFFISIMIFACVMNNAASFRRAYKSMSHHLYWLTELGFCPFELAQ